MNNQNTINSYSIYSTSVIILTSFIYFDQNFTAKVKKKKLEWKTGRHQLQKGMNES